MGTELLRAQIERLWCGVRWTKGGNKKRWF